LEKEARKEAGDTTPQSEEAESHGKKAKPQSLVLASNVVAKATAKLLNKSKKTKYTA